MPDSVANLEPDSDEHAKRLALIVSRFEHSERARRPYDDSFRHAWKHYQSFLDAKDPNWMFATDLYDPRFFSALQSHIAAEMEVIFAQYPVTRLAPVGRTPREAAAMMTDIVSHYFEQRRPKMALHNALLTRRLAGTVYLHTHWKTEKRFVGYHERVTLTAPQQDPMTGAVEEVPIGETLEYREGERTVVDAPWFDVLNFTDCYPDPDAEWVREGEYFIHRQTVSKRKLKRIAEEQEWDPEILERILESESPAPLSEMRQTQEWQEEIGFSGTNTDQLESREYFEIWEHMEPGRWDTVVNRSFIPRSRRNGFKHGEIPILQLKNYPLPGVHYGMSDWQVVEKLVRNINLMRNAGAHEALLSAHGILAVQRGAYVGELKTGPGAMWRLDSMDAAQFVERPSNGVNVSLNQAQVDASSLDEALGTNEAVRGTLPQNTNQKATSISLAVQSSGSRRALQTIGLDEMLLVPLVSDWVDMLQQFHPDEITVRLTDDPRAPARLVVFDEVRDSEFVAVPVGITSQMMELQQKRLMEFYQIVVGAQEESVDRRELVASLAELMIPHRARYVVKSEEQMMQEQQEAMMMQQMMMGAQGSLPVPAPSQFEQEQRGPDVEIARDIAGASTL